MRKFVHRGESLLKATVQVSQLRNLADDLKDARSPKRVGEGQRKVNEEGCSLCKRRLGGV
jgi:hypothetical protein